VSAKKRVSEAKGENERRRLARFGLWVRVDLTTVAAIHSSSEYFLSGALSPVDLIWAWVGGERT
jgi:hypothetical protein